MAIRCKKLHYLKLSITPRRQNSTVRNVLRSADMFDRVIKFECGYCNRKTQKSSLKIFTFDFIAVPCRGKRLRNYLEIWRSHERLGDKSMSSRPCFSLERKESIGSNEECGKVFLEKTIRFRIHDTTRKPFLRKLHFFFS